MRPAGVLSGVAIAVALALGSIALQSCGGDSGDNRVEERCDQCDGHIDPHCFDECQQFCLPDDPDCDSRCEDQCDQCKKDLRCVPCNGNCTGFTFRCAPLDEVITCDDGSFGGSNTSETPVPTATGGPAATATPTAVPTPSVSVSTSPSTSVSPTP